MRTLRSSMLPLVVASAVLGLMLAVLSPAQAAGRVIKINGLHIIHTYAQAELYLGRTPTGFQHFVVHRTKVVQREAKAAGAGPRCVRRSGAAITKYHTAGYAIGYEGGCGGAATLYTDYRNGHRHGGHYRMVKATQDSFYCPVLKRFKVPSALVGTQCYSPATHQMRPYHQL